MKAKTWKKLLVIGALVGAMAANSLTAFAYSVKVSKSDVNVRAQASTSSDVVGKAGNGKTYEVSGEESADGHTWYKISLDGKTGYIRDDLASKVDEAAAAPAPAADNTPAPTVTEIPTQGATTLKDGVNVRSKASAKGDKVATVDKGAAVTVTGTAEDSEGKTWYQVNFIQNDKNVTGFIRSDFLELQEVEEPEAEPEEEETEEEDYSDLPEENKNENNDYELVYTAGNDGVETWFVYDHINNKRMKLEDLMSAQSINENNLEIMNAKVAQQKMAIIVLAVLLALALIVCGIIGFKSRMSDYDYEDDDDDDDEDDEDEDDDDDEDDQPRRRGLFARRRRDDDDDDDEDDDDDDDDDEDEDVRVRRPVRRSAPAQERPVRAEGARQPQRRPSEGAGARQPQRRPAEGSGARQPQRRPAPGTVDPAAAKRVRKAPEGGAQRRPANDEKWKSKNFLLEEDDSELTFMNFGDED